MGNQSDYNKGIRSNLPLNVTHKDGRYYFRDYRTKSYLEAEYLAKRESNYVRKELSTKSLDGIPPAISLGFINQRYLMRNQGSYLAASFTQGLTFARSSGASIVDWQGNLKGVGVDEPRVGQYLWKGGDLVPAGIAVCSEVRTNLIKYSEDLPSWELTNGVTVTPQGSLGGSPSFVLSDQTTTYGHPRQVIGPIGEGEFTCQIKVAKTVGKTNAFGIRIVYTAGGVTHFNGISFNAETGGGILPTWNSSIIERVVQDCGDYWLAWFSFDTTGIGSNDARVEIFPAHNGVNGATGSTRTGDHRCTAVHVNEGRYPQNYIKTEGAQVSTAAETLEIDPVKLARAVGVFGPELPLNTAGQTVWDAETETATYVGGSYGAIHADLPDGEIAFVSGNLATGGTIQVKQNDGATYPLIYEGSDGYFEGLIIGANGVGLRMYLNDNASYPAATITNLQVHKVTMPDALTFVMKGTTSYADEGLNPQTRLALWQLDTDNRFRFQFNTVDGRTGQFVTLIETDGVANSSASAASVHTPGVEVPFSVAVVLTSTDIEGFYGGVSNGKVSHNGLPNLLSTPLSLLPVGTATIEHFAIYVGNPGSAALQEATS